MWIAVQTLLFAFLSKIDAELLNYIKNNSSKTLTNYLNDIIDFYSLHDVHFYYETTEDGDLINNLIKNSNFSNAFLHNFDFTKHNNFEQHLNRKILHIFNVNESQNLKTIENVRGADMACLIINENYFNNFSQSNSLRFLQNALIIVTKTNSTKIKAIHRFFYCKIKLLTTNNLKNKRRLQLSKISNFFGCTLKVAFVNYFPLAFCTEYGDRISVENEMHQLCSNLIGTEISLIQILRKKLNFKTVFILQENYIEMVNKTGRGIFDIAFGGITVSPDRTHLAKFTKIYWYESYNALFFRGDNLIDIFSSIKPLESGLWITIFVHYLFLAVIIDTFERFEKTVKIKRQNIFWVSSLSKFLCSFLIVLKS